MSRKRTVTVGVVLGLLASLVPASSTVAASTTATLTPAPVRKCGDVALEAARLAAAGRSGPASCIQRTALRVGAGNAVAADICGGSSTKTRIGACIVEDGILLIFLVPSGQVIGTIDYTVSGLTTLNYNSRQWTQSFHYRANSVTGQAAGAAVMDTFVYAEPKCIVSCTVSSSQLVGGSALPGLTHSATAYYSSPPGGYKWDAQSGFSFWFANPAWQTQQSNRLTTTPGVHRCDDALPGLPSGCVYHTVRPVLEIPSTRYPDYAYHIRLALNYRLPDVLTRTQNESLRQANYNTACPSGPNYPRPSGYHCDEYPFQSTYQGAAAQPYGRQFFFINWNTGQGFSCQVPWLQTRQQGDSGGFSACMIPAAQNVLGGSDLGNFYYTSRVLDGDDFQVRVI